MVGKRLNRTEAVSLLSQNREELLYAANRIRTRFCGNQYELCSIINAKSGRCSENCRFCAQSSFHCTHVEEYPLLDSDSIVAAAMQNEQAGAQRFSLVTSGRRLSQSETDRIADVFRIIRERSSIRLCLSCGLLSLDQFVYLKESGLTRYHNNLETSRRFFPEICTTHTIDDKIAALLAARQAGLELCSGGIIGLGETWEDRIDMAFAARELQVDSIPINVLNPIPGTPLADRPFLSNEEICKTMALFRLVYPTASIRLAGGRGLFPDKGRRALLSGCNGAITGGMLTTAGITTKDDLEMIESIGGKLIPIRD